ncbi:E3 ubiquitin-protein ligase [Monoraphidium neglectum]|uniref:non-specific serine/threonine protein kinase n=1 Tax=Monoraphidium neglectum TaxID=145388 RepID=A0A0D2M9V6_9CHLO|nr:E3 ubiquitin-protein ligase [Monoraphidium neglectum]KIY97751.1 E3 ubiquitin-protein ligase [Monoraphidium neglectum]|eukprot:XP_013896771.1 E3 ubiquitin-protein ligase [Monoraphidium neglectum]
MVRADQLQLCALLSRKGNSGEVWRGTLWGKQVAVKLVRIEDVDERLLDCLRREVAVLLHTTGECKQVCIYKGFCVKGSYFCIIMKLYGGSLSQRVARAPGKRLPLSLAVKWGADVAKGLVELHRLGVVCADLKPDNVLIDDEIGDAVIADFGISSVVAGTLGGGTGGGGGAAGARRACGARSSGNIRGTPNYMAPEQFGPRHLHTIKVDIWGFGCTFLHMITGSPPWAGDSVLQICTSVGVGKQAPQLPQGLPAELVRLLGSCMEADPSRRPAATQLLKVLQLVGPRVEPVAAGLRHAAAQRTQLLKAARSVLQGLQGDVVQLVREMDTGVIEGEDGAGAGEPDGKGDLDQYLQQLGMPMLQEASRPSAAASPSAPPLGCLEDIQQQQAALQQLQTPEPGAAASAAGVGAGGLPAPWLAPCPRQLLPPGWASAEPAERLSGGGGSGGGRHGRTMSAQLLQRPGAGALGGAGAGAGAPGALAAPLGGHHHRSYSEAAPGGAAGAAGPFGGAHYKQQQRRQQDDEAEEERRGRGTGAGAAVPWGSGKVPVGAPCAAGVAAAGKGGSKAGAGSGASTSSGSLPQQSDKQKQQQQQQQQQQQPTRTHSQKLQEACRLEAEAKAASDTGRPEAAEQLTRQALAILQAAAGAKHPNTIGCMGRLAGVLSRLGKAAEAEGLFKQVLQHREALLGRSHPQGGT